MRSVKNNNAILKTAWVLVRSKDLNLDTSLLNKSPKKYSALPDNRPSGVRRDQTAVWDMEFVIHGRNSGTL
jgi:hypothetical protein